MVSSGIQDSNTPAAPLSTVSIIAAVSNEFEAPGALIEDVLKTPSAKAALPSQAEDDCPLAPSTTRRAPIHPSPLVSTAIKKLNHAAGGGASTSVTPKPPQFVGTELKKRVSKTVPKTEDQSSTTPILAGTNIDLPMRVVTHLRPAKKLSLSSAVPPVIEKQESRQISPPIPRTPLQHDLSQQSLIGTPEDIPAPLSVRKRGDHSSPIVSPRVYSNQTSNELFDELESYLNEITVSPAPAKFVAKQHDEATLRKLLGLDDNGNRLPESKSEDTVTNTVDSGDSHESILDLFEAVSASKEDKGKGPARDLHIQDYDAARGTNVASEDELEFERQIHHGSTDEYHAESQQESRDLQTAIMESLRGFDSGSSSDTVAESSSAAEARQPSKSTSNDSLKQRNDAEVQDDYDDEDAASTTSDATVRENIGNTDNRRQSAALSTADFSDTDSFCRENSFRLSSASFESVNTESSGFETITSSDDPADDALPQQGEMPLPQLHRATSYRIPAPRRTPLFAALQASSIVPSRPPVNLGKRDATTPVRQYDTTPVDTTLKPRVSPPKPFPPFRKMSHDTTLTPTPLKTIATGKLDAVDSPPEIASPGLRWLNKLKSKASSANLASRRGIQKPADVRTPGVLASVLEDELTKTSRKTSTTSTTKNAGKDQLRRYTDSNMEIQQLQQDVVDQYYGATSPFDFLPKDPKKKGSYQQFTAYSDTPHKLWREEEKSRKASYGEAFPEIVDVRRERKEQRRASEAEEKCLHMPPPKEPKRIHANPLDLMLAGGGDGRIVGPTVGEINERRSEARRARRESRKGSSSGTYSAQDSASSRSSVARTQTISSKASSSGKRGLRGMFSAFAGSSSDQVSAGSSSARSGHSSPIANVRSDAVAESARRARTASTPLAESMSAVDDSPVAKPPTPAVPQQSPEAVKRQLFQRALAGKSIYPSDLT